MEEKLAKKIVIEDANDEVKEETNTKTKEKDRRSTKSKLETKNEEIKKLQADLNHWKNEYYKAYADMQNLRKALEKDFQSAFKYRTEGFIHELFPILDAFYIALNAEVNSKEMENFLIGFKYVYQNLLSVLEREGVKEIAPKEGDKFDFNTMYATETKEVEQKEDENKIVQLLNKGYFLKDRLIRPANVIVTKLKSSNEEEENNLEKSRQTDA